MKFNRSLSWAALPRLGFAIGLGLLVGGADLGCGGPQKKGDDQIPLSLGDWCKQVNSKLCNSVAQSCFKGISGFADGCLQTSMPSCLAGRDSKSASGRTKGELSACVEAVQALSCKELGKDLGGGKIAAMCGATAPGDPTKKPPATETPKPPTDEPKTTPAPST